MLNDHKNINQHWTSLRKITNEYIGRNHLCARIIDNLIFYLEKFSADGFIPFLDEWKSADSLYNEIITIKTATQKITGVAKGVNHKGHLLLELKDGNLKGFSSGDTSIIKNT